jgi:hypothetical protein
MDLLSMCEALGSIFSKIKKIAKREKERERERVMARSRNLPLF